MTARAASGLARAGKLQFAPNLAIGVIDVRLGAAGFA
jgi:hypothetical protein